MSPARRLDEVLVDRAAKAVADAFGESPGRLRGRSRSGRLPEARFALYTLLREFDDTATLSAIGRLLGRDHATIAAGLRRSRDLASAYLDYAERLTAARAIFSECSPAEQSLTPPAKRFPWL